jgi:hypothetical protein
MSEKSLTSYSQSYRTEERKLLSKAKKLTNAENPFGGIDPGNDY